MNRFNGVLKLHTVSPDSKFGWMGLPWLILFSSFLINLILSMLLNKDKGLYTGGLSSIFIYMFIAGIIGVNRTFPFALGFSIRRTDYFLGTSVVFCLVSLLDAVLLYLLSFIEFNLTDNWGTQLHFFHLPYISDGNALEQVGVYFFGMLHLCFLAFVITALYRRVGMLGLYIASGIIFAPFSILTILATYYNWWGDIFNWLGQFSAFGIVLLLCPLTALYALASYGLLRKATV